MFRVFQTSDILLRWTNHGWSDRDLCLGGLYLSPQFSSLDPEPSQGSLRYFGDVLDGSASCCSFDTQGVLPSDLGPLLPQTSRRLVLPSSTAFLLSFVLFVPRWCWEHPQVSTTLVHHVHQISVVQMQFCLQHSSLAFHFLPVFIAWATFGSLESLYISTSLVHVTLNSSQDFRGSWSFVVFPKKCNVTEASGQPQPYLGWLVLTFTHMIPLYIPIIVELLVKECVPCCSLGTPAYTYAYL